MRKIKIDFNFCFNLFILLGMAVAVTIVNVAELDSSQTQIWKQLIITVGALMGIVNTVLSANGNIWTFFFGVLDVCICSYANLDSGNMGQFIQHVAYFLPMQIVGFWQWRKRGAGEKTDDGSSAKVKARRLNGRQWLCVFASVVIGTVTAYFILYWIDLKRIDAGRLLEMDKSKIFLDATVVVLNIVGQILMSWAYAEQWYLWNVVNVFSIMLWLNRMFAAEASSYTVVMFIKYVFYLLNSINGLRIWLKLSREGTETEPAHKGCC